MVSRPWDHKDFKCEPLVVRDLQCELASKLIDVIYYRIWT